MAEIEIGTLYDINKQLVGQDKPLDPIEYAEKVGIAAHSMWNQKYYALICNERRYYTVFNCKVANLDNVKHELGSVLSSLGLVCDILPTKEDKDTYEIWIKDIATGEVNMYFLTDWTEGVIDC